MTASELRGMIGLGLIGRGSIGWKVPVIKTDTNSGQGIDELMSAIDDHCAYLRVSKEGKIRQFQIAEMRILKFAEQMFRLRFGQASDHRLRSVVEDTVARRLDPQSAARKLLRDW